MAEQPERFQRGKPEPSEWMAESLATARLQRLSPSMAAAGEMINRARAHLRSADLISATDPTLAVSACHDAARQAISAHLRATGYRVANEAGAHRLIVEYAEFVLSGVISGEDAVALDDLRRDRHTAEYGDFASRSINVETANEAVLLATRVVNSVAAALASQA